MRKLFATFLFVALSQGLGIAAEGTSARQAAKPPQSAPGVNVSDNEAAAIGRIRTLNTAEVTYAATYKVGFTDGLNRLGAPPSGKKPDKDNAFFVDEELAGRSKGGTNTSFERKGYKFTYKPGAADSKGNIGAYTIVVRPIQFGKTGKRSFFSDQTGKIHATSDDREPTAKDPPL